MARVVDNNHFAADWQKPGKTKDYSAELHQQNNAARATTQALDKARLDANQTTRKPQDAARTPAEAPRPDVKDLPQAMQSARLETQGQAQATKHVEDARQQFLADRDAAKGLKTLENKGPQPTASSETALNNAVTQRANAANAHLAKNSQQPQVQPQVIPQQQAQPRAEARNRGTDAGRQTKATDRANREPQAENLAQQPKTTPNVQQLQVAANVAAATNVQQAEVATESRADGPQDTDRASSDEGDGTTSEGSEGSTSGITTPRPGARESRNLNALLGGFSGSSSDANADGGESSEAAVAVDAAARPALPEMDQNFHVYSEFDEANPGIEWVKSRAQVYSQFVEKRLTQIAKLDADVGEKLKDICGTRSFRERMVGELKDELKVTDFLGSVYGGLIA